MEILLREELVEAIGKPKLKKFGVRDDDFRWKDEIKIDLKKMEPHQIQYLQNLLEPHKEIYGTKTCLKGIETFLSVFEGELPKIVKVDLFDSALIQYLVNTERKWLYHKVDEIETQWVASRVTKIEYHAKVPDTYERSGHPEYVEVEFVYEQFATERKFSEVFYAGDILRKTVPEILALRGFYIETEELRRGYLEHLEKYSKVIKQIGQQYLLDGIAINQTPDDVDEHYHSEKTKEKIRDYVLNKVVIDIFKEHETEDTDRWSNYGYTHHDNGGYFWERNEDLIRRKKRKKVEEHVEDPVVEIPVHPFVIIFDLQRHMRLSTHITTLTKYVYDKTLSEKLILPDNIKELINILIEHKAGGFKDIIRGKSGGAIILLTGLAGIGKTLTAEVFAESTERALYSVQASQLGLNAEELEKTLKLVLRRASRWNAILLLDEADVYVHERQNNLIQNAIVGVFLRILEYHTSIMFMTTNRPDIVDDAIASRCIARIDYHYPSKEDQKKIWRVLADSASIKLTNEAINQFVENHNDFSGRDIKNILKLANLKAVAEGKPINISHIDYVQQFNPTIVQKELDKKLIEHSKMKK